MKICTFTAIVHKEDDVYIAECPEVGTVDQGETIEQALAGLKEATRLYLEELLLPETSPQNHVQLNLPRIAFIPHQQ